MESLLITALITAGISILVGLILLFVEHRTKWFAKFSSARDHEPAITSSNTSHFSSSEYRERPYPRDIIEEINKLPPLQRESSANGYIGLKVRWRATYHTAFGTKAKNSVILMMKDANNHYPWINSEIDFSNTQRQKPQSKGTKCGSQVT